MAVNPVTLTHDRDPGKWHSPGTIGGPDLEGKGFRYLGGAGAGGGNTPPMGILSAFLPGQRNALAQQLNQGFGGGLKQWNGILGDTYSGMRFTPNALGYPNNDQTGNNNGGNDGKGGDNNNNGGGNNGGGGFDTGHYNPGSVSSAPYLGGARQPQNARPGMQVQAPQMMPNAGQMQMPMPGIQGPIPQQMQQPMQPQMMLGQQPQMGAPSGLSPQVMAMLRARFGGQ
jgi:hypothetical protein